MKPGESLGDLVERLREEAVNRWGQDFTDGPMSGFERTAQAIWVVENFELDQDERLHGVSGRK